MSEVIAVIMGVVIGAVFMFLSYEKDLDCYQAVVLNGKSECAVYINKSVMEKLNDTDTR